MEYSDDIGKHCSSIRFSNLIGPGLSSEYFLGSLIRQVVNQLHESNIQNKSKSSSVTFRLAEIFLMSEMRLHV